MIDFSRWKLTLPTGPREHPTEVTSAALRAGFEQRPHFWRQSDGAQVFAAPVDGVSTSGSNNPRSELREMNPDGSKAAWSSTKGTHRMKVRLAFTRLPTGNPGVGVVGAQIHSSSDDETVLRLEGRKLWVTKGDAKYRLVTDAYVLGTPIDCEFRVAQGHTEVLCDGRLIANLYKKYSKAYFKTGCYTQCNAGVKPKNSTNYGEVIVYSVEVSHTP